MLLLLLKSPGATRIHVTVSSCWCFVQLKPFLSCLNFLVVQPDRLSLVQLQNAASGKKFSEIPPFWSFDILETKFALIEFYFPFCNQWLVQILIHSRTEKLKCFIRCLNTNISSLPHQHVRKVTLIHLMLETVRISTKQGTRNSYPLSGMLI